MQWEIDKTALIELLGRTIYKPENVLVEIAANSYDADAALARIVSSGENRLIQIQDDGCGMDEDDLRILTTIARSKKKDRIENKLSTPKFARKYLGSFGIGIISFLSLGSCIRIFTKKKDGQVYFIEITRTEDTHGKTIDIPISDVKASPEYASHLINGVSSESGTTIEIENTKLDFAENYKLLRYKLSNLPLSHNFKVFLNDSEVACEDYPTNSWLNKQFTIKLDEIDPTYVSDVKLHAYYDEENPNATIDEFRRGIFFKVHGRVIEHNLFWDIKHKLTSPGSIDARIVGHVEADYLFDKIQANREDFFDNKITESICNAIEAPVQALINDFLLLKNYVSEEKYINAFNTEKQLSIDRISNVHQHLDKLGLKFKYKPGSEQELVVIISELCQKNILPFEIIKTNSGSHIDCFAKWPITQSRRMPDFVGHLEIELSLHKFFIHQHDYRTKPEICCWDIDERQFEREVSRYKRERPESIESVSLIDPTPENKQHFGHHKEVHVRIRKLHDEYEVKILRVYIISRIVEDAASNI